MPPQVPQDPIEREQMWDHPYRNIDPVNHNDPLERADHLDDEAKTRVALFPEMVDLLRSRFGLSRDTDQHWFPVRPLGKGGFGGVAVWERRDSAGAIVEETAVKQSKWSKAMATRTKPYLSKEAVIMQQLNKKNSENIVYMKAFKYFQEEKPNRATWRFYFEYCPYGDLSRLEKRYKAWGTYLPEEFLWKAFHSMAQVAKVMEDGDYYNLETGVAPHIPYDLIHSDIKPLNVFLGYHAQRESPWHTYPVVKVGDWGLASLTNPSDVNNPRRFVNHGTAWYLPPESRGKKDVVKYEDWEKPQFILASVTKSELERNEYPPSYTDRKVDPSHNIWAFGMTMWELLTLESPKTFSDRLNAMTEDEYNAWGHNTTATITTHKQPEYSYELRHLVRQCLNLRPSLRPTAAQILEVTGSKVEQCEEQAAKTNTRVKNHFQPATYTYQLPRLYFKENEINHMPLGPHLQDFGFNGKYQANFAFEEDKFARPVWGPIEHPNRARWAWRYEQLVQLNRQKQENTHRKRVQETTDLSTAEAPSRLVRDQFPRAPRPAHPRERAGGLDRARRKILVLPRSPFTRSTPVQQGGSTAVDDTPPAQRTGREAKPPQDGLNSIDQALLASHRSPESCERSRTNVRRKRMRLWNDQAPTFPKPTLGEWSREEAADKDVSMTDC